MRRICIQSSDTVTVGRGVGVNRGVGVRVGVGVGVIVYVGVMVGVTHWGGDVTVAVEDGEGMGVEDGVEVTEEVMEAVPVGVSVPVALGVVDGVLVLVAVREAVAVGEKVWVGVAESVGLAADGEIATMPVAVGATPHPASALAPTTRSNTTLRTMERRLIRDVLRGG